MTRVPRIILSVAIAVTVAMAGAAFWAARAKGFSARAEPSAAERLIARAARRWAVPRASRDAVNPVPFEAAALVEARAHFADHCASCHANDGSGQTELGRGLFPRAPDMRLAQTQDKTDGELYWIIENGIRLTGMPAWGAGGGNDADTWKLVHFIRRLNDLTAADLEVMESLNPKSPHELEEEQADERFLSGEADAPPDGHHHD